MVCGGLSDILPVGWQSQSGLHPGFICRRTETDRFAAVRRRLPPTGRHANESRPAGHEPPRIVRCVPRAGLPGPVLAHAVIPVTTYTVNHETGSSSASRTFCARAVEVNGFPRKW